LSTPFSVFFTLFSAVGKYPLKRGLLSAPCGQTCYNPGKPGPFKEKPSLPVRFWLKQKAVCAMIQFIEREPAVRAIPRIIYK
jgi:hypothetical protein